MISKDYFTSRISEASLLLNGKYLPKEHEQAIYEQLKGEELTDFSKAITDLIDKGDRLNFPVLRNLVNKYKEAREEYEYINKKKKEEESFKIFINNIENNCKGGDCCKCNEKDYCPTIKNELINSLKKISSGEINIDKELKRISNIFKETT